MDKKKIIYLLKSECAKLNGNMATYDKFADKNSFYAKVQQNLETIKELYGELIKAEKGDGE